MMTMIAKTKIVSAVSSQSLKFLFFMVNFHVN